MQIDCENPRFNNRKKFDSVPDSAMAGPVHFSGVRIPFLVKKSCFSSFPLLSKSSTQFEYAASSVSSSGLLAAFGDGCIRRALKVGYKKGVEAMLREEASEDESSNDNVERLACVMKFGGSSLASAERMREVADLVLRFRDERPVIVLSAMGKTTNNLLLVMRL